MDNDRFPLRTSRNTNPLRPYYVPPTIGATPASGLPPSHNVRNSSIGGGSISDSARDLLPQLDLDLNSSASEVWQNTRSLFDTLAYRYSSALLAQPFDVAKLILQVSFPPSSQVAAGTPSKRASSYSGRSATSSRSGSMRGRHNGYASPLAEDFSGDSDASDEIADYFSATAPRSRSPRKRRRHVVEEHSPSPTPTPKSRKGRDACYPYKLTLKQPDSIIHAIGSIYNISGVTGLWRATNCTFLYNALLKTTDSFLRSLLLAILGLPEISGPDQIGLAPAINAPGSLGFSGLDLSDTPNAIGSLIVVGLASSLAGLLLSPLDQVRTRLIITPFHLPPRGLLQNLRRLPSLVAPSILWTPTIIAHGIPQIFSAASPLVLRHYLKITPENAPSIWSIAAFTTCLTDLFIRLPLETIVRRAQVKVIQETEPGLPLIIEPAPSYESISKTVWSILYEEGETRTKDGRGLVRVRKGQGVAGLVRGWRAGFWGIVGVWGAGALGPKDSKSRGEF